MRFKVYLPINVLSLTNSCLKGQEACEHSLQNHTCEHTLESGHGTLSDYTSHAPLKNLENWKRTVTQKAITDSSVAIWVDDQVMRVIQERYN